MSKKKRPDAIARFIAAQEEFIDAQIALRAAPREPSHRNDTARCRSRFAMARQRLRESLEKVLGEHVGLVEETPAMRAVLQEV